MQDGWSYIKDTGDFLWKIKRLGKISEGAILVIADVVGALPQHSSRFGFALFKERA